MGSKDVVPPQFVEPTAGQKTLAKLLAKLGLITEDQLAAKALYQDYDPIGHYSHLGCFEEWDAIEKVAKHLRIQSHRFEKSDKVNAFKLFENEQIKKVPLLVWKKIKAIPISLWGKELLVSMVNPVDMEAIKSLEFDLQLKLRIVIGKESEILSVLSNRTDINDGLDFKTLLEKNEGPVLKQLKTEPVPLESNISSEDISAPTIIRLVNKIFAGAIQKGASDVHISPEQGRLAVRVRVDGIMRNFLDIPEGFKDAVVSRIKVLCGMDITEKRQPQDGRLRVKTNQGNRDLRISTVPIAYGENIVARILSSDMKGKSFEELGMPHVIENLYMRAVHASSKVNLVCGPTGSGKTSTLYAGIMKLADGQSNIITVEDPIEYRIAGINQIQVNTKVGMTFAKALRSVLRQDPDIIMVGEIRDPETAAIAMQVAQTGHVVLSTIHTNTAAAAITRLRDLGIPPYLIASSLGSILAQRLVRQLCPNCKVPLSGEALERAQALKLDCQNLFQASGCEECENTSYHGRLGVYSFLDVSPDIAAAIRDEKGEQEIEKIARSYGFTSLDQSALDLAYAGKTSIEEIERVLGPLDSSHIKINEQLAVVLKNAIDQAPLREGEAELGVIPKRKVLVVDDDENIREIYQMILEYEMFDVAQAENGQEALKMIYENRPEIVLLDLMMPRMGGLEMIEKLRTDPRTKDIPVLILTAADNDDNELELIKRGADDFISKTSKSEIIVARINRLLNRV